MKNFKENENPIDSLIKSYRITVVPCKILVSYIRLDWQPTPTYIVGKRLFVDYFLVRFYLSYFLNYLINATLTIQLWMKDVTVILTQHIKSVQVLAPSLVRIGTI